MKKTIAFKLAIIISVMAFIAITLTACGTKPVTESPGNFSPDMTPVQTPDAPRLPPLTGDPVKDSHELADAFVSALNDGRDLTGDESAMDSWRDLLDFGQMPVHSGGLYDVEFSENLYQFTVVGKTYDGDVVSVTVLINLQEQEPWFFCPYTRYYHYAEPTAANYLALLAEGDVKRLAIWLSVDGGPDPGDDFIQQAEWGLLEYGVYDLKSASVTAVRYDDEARRFICEVEDAQGGSFEIRLIYGDGLIMPVGWYE